MDIHSIVQDVATVATAAGVVWGIWRAVPIFRRHVEIIGERDRALNRALVAEETVKILRLSNDGWKDRIDQLAAQIDGLDERVVGMQHKLAIAVRWICEVQQSSVRNTDRLPPIPDELREDIDASLRARLGSDHA